MTVSPLVWEDDTLLTCAQRLDHPRFTSRILAKTQPQASTSWADKSFDL